MKLKIVKEALMGKLIAAVAVLGLLALTGCATTPVPSNGALTPEQQSEIVKKRFQERWDAIIAKDYAKAYEYLSPATRKMLTLEQYQPIAARGAFQKAEFREAKCADDVCMVKFMLTYDFGRVKGATSLTGEKWFFQDGQAWFNLPKE